MARECEATPQGARDWHLDQIGLPAAGAGGEGVAVSLIDTGVHADLPLPAKISAESDAARVPDGEHGSAMATLVNSVAPDALITVYRGLTTPEGGPVSDVANALQRALDARDSAADHVINLSLGWAPEFSSHDEDDSRLTGSVEAPGTPRPEDDTLPACTIFEDPIGESVRTQLERARLRPNTVVIASAGNRNQGGAIAEGQPGDLFVPARWRNSAIGVGAMGWDWIARTNGTQPWPQGIDFERRPVFWAPGLEVVAPLAGHESRPWSGSSVAAAIASGLAARLLGANPSAEEPGTWVRRFHDELSIDWHQGMRRLVAAGSLDEAATCEGKLCTPPTPEESLPVDEVCGPIEEIDVDPANPGGMGPPETRRSNYATGSVGPQPDWGCGECFVRARGSIAEVVLTFDSATLKGMAGNPELVVSDGKRIPLVPKTAWRDVTGSQIFKVPVGGSAYFKSYRISYVRRLTFYYPILRNDYLPKRWF